MLFPLPHFETDRNKMTKDQNKDQNTGGKTKTEKMSAGVNFPCFSVFLLFSVLCFGFVLVFHAKTHPQKGVHEPTIFPVAA